MICNMTHFGHHVTLARLDLRSNFDLDLSKSFYIWFDAPLRDKHDGVKFVALPLKLTILLSKNRFGKFWNFDPWWPQFWPEPKNDQNDFEMIFRELSNAAFRFFLRRPGAEIMGGRSNAPPPPSRRWKIQRPSRARVNIDKCDFMWLGPKKQSQQNICGRETVKRIKILGVWFSAVEDCSQANLDEAGRKIKKTIEIWGQAILP